MILLITCAMECAYQLTYPVIILVWTMFYGGPIEEKDFLVLTNVPNLIETYTKPTIFTCKAFLVLMDIVYLDLWHAMDLAPLI